MRERAKEQFGKRLERWQTWCAAQNLPAPTLHLLDMPKRWGSTHANGQLYLNPELVRAPAVCIEYVIAHEICHIRHQRHDKNFYAELAKLCPNWRDLKQRLAVIEL